MHFMKYDGILIRYGEMSLKGKNRNRFEDRLLTNVSNALSAFPNVHVSKRFRRMYIDLNGQEYEPVKDALKKVFGIQSFSPVKIVPLELEPIREIALQVFRDASSSSPSTFKVDVRRANKRFPHNSMEMNHLVGSYILQRSPQLTVDVHQPDLTVSVDIREEGAYIFSQIVYGGGGLPTGSNGKGMLLLSGGIDSPVAGYLAMKRGVQVEAVHFHSYPYTSEKAKQKVIELARILTQYGGPIRLHMVSLTDIQTEIRRHCPDSLTITIMRRMMMRIAERLADKRGAAAIITGESLGQVASQTLESMQVIHQTARLPIIQPAIALDKTEIISLAERIGTYELSILPYEDCCTIFLPKSPATKPNLLATERAEHKFDYQPMIDDAVNKVETLTIQPNKTPLEIIEYF